MMKKIIFLAFTFLNISAVAQTFTYNGINYKVLDFFPPNVEVGINPNFVGVANIPATVIYNNQTFNVTAVGYSAFADCSGLTSFTIPDSVTYIGMNAFKNCDGLTSLTIPDSVTGINFGAFSYCDNLTTATYPTTATDIASSVFRNCYNLTSFDIPDSVTYIGDCAFSHCSSLMSIDIPNGVHSIWGSAFRYCSGLTSVFIPNSVSYLGQAAFAGCSSLTSVNIPYLVSEIPPYVFSGCTSLTSFIIPDNVTTIQTSAFMYCSGLTSITIPAAVHKIYDKAFYNCFSLTTVNCDIINPLLCQISADSFGGVNQNNCALNVNNASAPAYQTAAVWENFNPINGVLSNNSFVKNNFSIYPNPSTDIINILLDNNLHLEKVNIYNPLGQVVKTSAFAIISTSALARGSYIVEVVTDKGKATKVLLIK